MSETRLVNFRMRVSDYKKLEKIAKKENRDVSTMIRRYIEKGMSLDAYANDEEKILMNMKRAVGEVIEPKLERMIAISVKNAISTTISSLNIYLFLYSMLNNGNKHRAETILQAARREAILFVKQDKGTIEDFLKKATDRLTAIWEG